MPSLYEATATVGDVAASNFTTLYNASNLTVPNAGAGSVSGNLNVAGNLTVQGTSLLVGAVTVGSTLSTPNYTFPLPDGTTDQVMTTDGNGNLYWTSIGTLGGNYTIQADTAVGGGNLTLVSSLGATDSVKFASGTGINVARTDANTITISNTGTGTTYTIDASTTTGGANLNLVGSDATTDSVKFAAGTNVTITRTDANTITFAATAGSSIPNGTAQGQVLYWDGSAWTADSVIGAATAGARFITSYINNTAGSNSALFLRKDYTTTNYSEANADGVGMSYTLDSNAQGVSSFGLTQFAYSTTDPTFTVASSTNNFATRTLLLNLNKASASLYAPELVLNATQTGTPTLNAVITANRGSSTDATITWNETNTRWEFNQNIFGSGTLVLNGAISTAAESISMNTDNTAADSVLNFRSATYLKWNNTASRFELSNGITIGGNTSVTGTIDATGVITTTAQSMSMNTGNVAADSYLYLKSTTQYIKWNNTAGQFELSDPLFITNTSVPGTFERQVTAAATSPDEIKTALKLIERVTDAGSNATNDAGPAIMFARTSGASGGAEVQFANIGAAYYGATNTADIRFNWSDDNFTETSPGVFPGTYNLLRLGAADANFFNNGIFINYATAGATKVGINTGTPNYTLDVNGDANVSGDIYFNGVQLDINSPQAGQVITYNGTKFLNSATMSWASTTYRTTFQGDNGIAGRAQAAASFVNNTGAIAYGQGDGSGILMGVDSDSQPLSLIGSAITQYDISGNHSFRVSTSTNSFANITATSITGGNTLVFGAAHGLSAGQRIVYLTTTQNGLVQNTYYYVLATGLTTTQCQISLTSGGSAVALTNGAGLTLNFQTGSIRLLNADQTELDVTAPLLKLNAIGTGVASVDASIVVERGTSGSDVSIKWNSSTNRWQDTTDGTTFYNLPNQNLDTTDDVNFSSVTIDNLSGINTQEVTTTSTATTFISTSTRMTQKSIIEITDNVTGEMHVLEALAFRKGTTAYLTTYGEMYTASSLATFTADVAGGFTRILATPASSNSTTFKVVRISLD
jgi:hypothetical protein